MKGVMSRGEHCMKTTVVVLNYLNLESYEHDHDYANPSDS